MAIKKKPDSINVYSILTNIGPNSGEVYAQVPVYLQKAIAS